MLATTACTPSSTGGNATTTAVAGTAVGVDLDGLNKQVKPGDDFDEYANGGWRAKTEIPADRASIGTGLMVFNKAEANNVAIIQAAIKANAAAGTDTRRIADWYTSFTDTAGIEARGIAPLNADMAAVAAITDNKTLSTALGGNVRVDVDPLNATDYNTENLFGLFVSQSFDKPDVTMPYVLQGGLGLPDRDYYISGDAQMAALRTKYQAYVTQLFTLAKMSDPAARAKRVFDLETKIAQAHTDNVTSQDAHKANNPWTKADFAKKAPGIDWDAFWNAAGLGNQSDFIVWHPATTVKLAQLVANEPLDSWKDWLVFHSINPVTAVLPATFDQARFDFFGKEMSGQQQQRPRDKRAIGSVNNNLGDAVGQLYV
ncbi:MAG: M13 family peptidase, partial [Sphingomonadales bacterium]